VVYGDTDSMFVHTGTDDLAAARASGAAIKREVGVGAGEGAGEQKTDCDGDERMCRCSYHPQVQTCGRTPQQHS
jgi:hypothetical protein